MAKTPLFSRAINTSVCIFAERLTLFHHKAPSSYHSSNLHEATFILFTFCGCAFRYRGAYAQTVYDIYPIPQRQVAGKGLVSFSKSVTVVCDAAIDAATRRRAEQVLKDAQLECTFATEAPATGAVLYLGVNGSGEVADLRATALNLDRSVFSKTGKYDRHILSLSDRNGSAEVVIIGENTDAAFFGLASLEQMLEKAQATFPK